MRPLRTGGSLSLSDNEFDSDDELDMPMPLRMRPSGAISAPSTPEISTSDSLSAPKKD